MSRTEREEMQKLIEEDCSIEKAIERVQAMEDGKEIPSTLVHVPGRSGFYVLTTDRAFMKLMQAWGRVGGWGRRRRKGRRR